MAKRRRERDRPKLGPDALYDPNKRILLSYSSDGNDRDVNEERSTRDHLDDGAQYAEHYIAPYPEESGDVHEQPGQEEWEEVEVQNGGKDGEAKETGEVEPGEDGEELSSHQTRETKEKNGGSVVRKNQATNQRPALGSLAFQWEDGDAVNEEEYDSTGEEAMSYLQAVR